MPYYVNKNPFIVKTLDISTIHIHKKDAELLLSHSMMANPITSYSYDEGIFVYISEDSIDYEGIFVCTLFEYGYSKEFVAIIEKAAELKCKYVQFDSDGIVYEDLPKMEW